LIRRASLVLFLALAAGAAMAQKTPIYRCGQTYSQVPCPDGHLIDSADPRTAAQRAQARRAAEAEKQQAARLERERSAAEAAAATPAATLTAAAAHAPASAPAKARKKKATKKDPGTSTAGNTLYLAPRPTQQ
jgi:hypothetical protein